MTDNRKYKIPFSELVDRLTVDQIKLLKKKPFLHDKLEFQVIPTCFNFNIDDEIKKIQLKKEPGKDPKLYPNPNEQVS